MSNGMGNGSRDGVEHRNGEGTQQWLNQKIAQFQGLENPNTRLNYYGTVMVQADDLAKTRGKGLFNEVPKKEQTTDRGRAYQNALEVYAKSVNYIDDKKLKEKMYDKYEKSWATVEGLLDQDKREPYVVGSSYHPEQPGSWNTPDFEFSRGDNQYIVWACNSMNMQPNPLLNFLFSTDNVNYIQQQIVDEVYRIRQVQIAKQSTDELLIIMRNKYQYALSGWLPRDINNLSKVYPRGDVKNPNGLAYDSNSSGCSNLEFQLLQINRSILEECIKQVLSGIDSYLQYYKDASSLPMPLSRSVYVSSKGSNELLPNIAFESGHENTKIASSFNQRFNII
jgi:Family of unknown function (DUF5761)